MPIYEYVCTECGCGFERLQTYSEPPTEACPECDGKVRRVIAPAGVIFKGKGWYITDSRRQLSDQKDGKRKEAKTDAASGEAKPAKADTGATPSSSGREGKGTGSSSGREG